jgi:hypothetical protein
VHPLLLAALALVAVRFRDNKMMARRRGRRETKHQQQAKARKRRSETATTPATLDRRALSAEVTAIDGRPLSEPHIVVVIEPVRLPGGEDLYFESPFVVPFYLGKSKALRDAAEPKRISAITKTRREKDGSLRPLNSSEAFDAIEDLALAVILAAAAVEAHANDMIGRLPDDAMLEVPTRLAGKTVPVMRGASSSLKGVISRGPGKGISERDEVIVCTD